MYKEEEDINDKNELSKTNLKKDAISKKESKDIQKIEKQKQKELKKERKRQRELARAKKKFGINNLENTTSNFSLSPEEAKVLLKFAKQVIGKEENVTIDTKEQEVKDIQRKK